MISTGMPTHVPTVAQKPRRRVKRRAKKRLSLGRLVGWWIENHLVHGEGDYFGKPFLLEKPWQWDMLEAIYALLPAGTRRYDDVLVGLPKGQGKTPLAAAVACAEFARPVAFDGWAKHGNPCGTPRLSPYI